MPSFAHISLLWLPLIFNDFSIMSWHNFCVATFLAFIDLLCAYVIRAVYGCLVRPLEHYIILYYIILYYIILYHIISYHMSALLLVRTVLTSSRLTLHCITLYCFLYCIVFILLFPLCLLNPKLNLTLMFICTSK